MAVGVYVLSPQQVSRIRDLLSAPDLQVFAQTEWSSENSDHRQLMRDFVSTHPAAFHNLSHTKGLGLIALHRFPVGVDAEESARVTEPAVLRISHEEERALAPSAASLWCAKEAAFKALRAFQQPSVLSQISVGDWENIDSQTETFRLLNAQKHAAPENGRGLVLKFSEWTFAFFIFNS